MYHIQDNLRKILYRSARLVFSTRTLHLMKFDLIRLRTRLKHYGQKGITPPYNKLHVGCGVYHVKGWLNIDVVNSDYDVDLACGQLPWRSEVFESVVSLHVIEHLELIWEFIPLLYELHRVLKPGGEIWLSCPDIEKTCRSYLEHGMADLLEDREKRLSSYSYSLGKIPMLALEGHKAQQLSYLLSKTPTSHLINELFHQWGEHKNLYDFRLLEWALTETGFTNIQPVVSDDLSLRFPEFPSRNDDLQSIYVRAIAS